MRDLPGTHQTGCYHGFIRYLNRQFSWPDVLRWKGSVILSTFVPVLCMSLFSLGVYICYESYDLYVTIPLSVLTSVSVALGLLLAFRVNTAYERYNNGRCLIQTVTATIRNLSRQIWINIPENTKQDHIQKMRCIKLLLAFFVATKHHLRQEYGIEYYDLKELLPKDWVPASVKHGAKEAVSKDSRTSITKLNLRKNAQRIVHDIKSLPLVVSLHDSIKPRHGDDFLHPDDRNDVHNIRRSLIREYYPDSDFIDSSAPQIQRRLVNITLAEEQQQQQQSSTNNNENEPLLKKSNSTATYNSTRSKVPSVPAEHGDTSPFTCDEDLADDGDGDIALPLEILYRIALYINTVKAAGKIESNFVSVTTNSLDTLVNTFTAFERIVHTPIPKAYNIHLKQGVVLYIFFLPFTLVESLGYLVVPVAALVSFTLFGILAIGNEIENPFGYDYNDLPMNRYCDELKREVEYILYAIPSQSTSILLDGQ
ncbi:unnamed protein product [Cunninghamella blakesleeana]